MSNTPQQPRPDDAVLGGQFQAPIDGAVLGGIESVRQRLATDNIEVKKIALPQALNYGEKGVEVLFEVLEKEKNLDIQWLAYQLLKNQNNSEIKVRLNNCLLFYEYESVMVNRRGGILKRTPGKARYFREDLGNGIYLDMTYIPGGTFLMGSPQSEQDSRDNERPQHQVTIPPFWMGKYAVTQEQWQAIMGNNHSRFMGNNPSSFNEAKRPVETFNWNDCQEFCQKLSQRTQKAYGLPSEAQWEYGCRAGTLTPFHCGETITTDLANYSSNRTYGDAGKKLYRTKTVEVGSCPPNPNYAEAGEQIYRGETVEVGSFPPNPFGLYDMHGNVWEWCGDAWHDDYALKPQKLQQNGSIPWSSSNKMGHLLRGGNWCCPPMYCRSACRGHGSDPFGFRLVLSIP